MWVRAYICVHACICVQSGMDLVIFGHGRRGAMTACGLRTEDPVFFLERGEIEERRRGGGAGGLRSPLLWTSCYPAATFLTYRWVSVNVRSSQSQICPPTISWRGINPLRFWQLIDAWRRNLLLDCICQCPAQGRWSEPSACCLHGLAEGRRGALDLCVVVRHYIIK